VKYRIDRHIQYRLKRPYSKSSDDIRINSKNKAYERKDEEPSLRVNVLIMAKEKKNKNGRLTAGDLISKLAPKKQREEVYLEQEEEFISDETYVSDVDEVEEEYDSIDVSSNSDDEFESESNLDINALLRKYMPEFLSDSNENDTPQNSGVLSGLKNAADNDEFQNDEEAIDESLFGDLDAAFADEQDVYFEHQVADDGFISEFEIEDENVEDEYVEDEFVEDENLEEEFADDELEDEYPVDEYAEDGDEPIYDEEYTEDLQSSFEEAQDGQYSEEIESNETESGESDADELSSSDEVSNEEAARSVADDEFDPTDINLMVAFGLDSENGGSKKSRKAKALGDRLEADQNEHEAKVVKLDRPEFVDKSQIPLIRGEFIKRRRGLATRIGICAIISLILLIYENIPTLSGWFTGSAKQFGGVLDPEVYPVVYVMISLQLMLFACLCAFDQIVDGIKHIFRGIPSPESMTVLLTLAGIVYSAVICRFVSASEAPVTFNFIVALNALLSLVYAWYNNKREMMNFRIIANKRPKHIVRRLLDEESECEAKAFADKDDVCDVMKIEKTDFIDGFFGRLSKPNQTTNVFMMFLMGIAVVVAILFGLFAKFRGGDASDVSAAIYSSLLLIAPMSIYITFSYPFYRANVVAREYDSAIIGETSLDEYSNASIISFDDKNVFPSYSVKVQNIRIYNNARIDRVLYYASSVFAYAGGPLQDVFEVATKDMGNSTNVKIYDTEAGFLATQVDGVNIIFGTCDALRSRGLEIPDSAAQDDVDLSNELSIMYMFRESKLVAKMYIKYVMDADIDLILKQFAGSGLYVCVRTFDPNIDERMIAKTLNMKRMPLKIVRYSSADEVGSYEAKADSGLVTCGSPKSLLQVISYCAKVLNMKKTNVALSVLSIMISVSILLLLLLSDSLTSMNSLFIALYQLIWLIPMSVASKMYIR